MASIASAGRTVAEVRGMGLMIGIEFAHPETNAPLPEIARRVRDECFARGLFCALGGRKDATLRLLPPLIVTREEIDEALSIVDDALRAVTLNGTHDLESPRNGSSAGV